MELSDRDFALVGALADGLPLIERPYGALGEAIGIPESEVLKRLAWMVEAGVIRRFGVVVHHRKLGYDTNAMTVWDLPDECVSEVGQAFAASGLVSLCYRRPRQLPDWPYNLFCMVHGHCRAEVEATVNALAKMCDVENIPHRLLFSTRCFKQRGATYRRSA